MQHNAVHARLTEAGKQVVRAFKTNLAAPNQTPNALAKHTLINTFANKTGPSFPLAGILTRTIHPDTLPTGALSASL
jgi:hypothetical protein